MASWRIDEILNRVVDWANSALKVSVTGSLPALSAGTNNIGDVDIASPLPAGTNTIGYVGITGSPEVLVLSNNNKTASLAAGANESFYIKTSAGHLGRLEHLGIYIPAPSGAGSGTHNVLVALGDTVTPLQVLSVTAAFGAAIQIVNGVVVGTATILPTTDQHALAELLKGHTLGETDLEGIFVRYTNSTDVAQTGTRQYRSRHVEWPIA